MKTINIQKLYDMAEGLQKDIDDKRRPRDENTPKRQCQAKSARIEADKLERCQKALIALADAHTRGDCPDILMDIRTKSDILPMVATHVNCRSYYDLQDTGQYHDTSERAVALRQLMAESVSAEEAARIQARQTLSKIKDLEANVRFGDIPDFFPTPLSVIDRMLEKVVRFDGSGVVLDSSAGKGDILAAAQQRWPDARCVYCERHYTLCDILDAKGFVGVRGDFLEEPPQPIVDLACINPPYASSADIDHIRHTYDFIKPGGELVALASAGVKFNSRPKFENFRTWLTEKDADIYDLPPDSFNSSDAFRKTGVSVVCIYIVKPE